MELVRGITTEWASARVVLPMSKKPLPVDPVGGRDAQKWNDILYKEDPAAQVGDMVQTTKVKIGVDKIELEINDGGTKG